MIAKKSATKSAKKAVKKAARKSALPDPIYPGTGRPATRALATIGVTKVEQLVQHREADLAQLHGMGPKALRILKEALKEQGKSFRS